jgi:hypothetical protein
MASKRDDTSWFPRFADIPGVSWTTPPGIDRRQIRGHDLVPETSDWDTDRVYWPSMDRGEEDSSTTATPAQQYVGGDWSGSKTVDAVVRSMAEALELPGTPSDYHFIIAGAQERLWKLRQTEPAALNEVEGLCWLDIELVRARPEIIAPYNEDEPTLHMAVLDVLYRLYLREGYLAEAEQVATIAVTEFDEGHFQRQLDEAHARRAVLEAEDAA